MYEIELKAHVTDRDSVIKALGSFASYAGGLDKKDTYYHLPRHSSNPAVTPSDDSVLSEDSADYISCRIRYETHIGSAGKCSVQENVCTPEACGTGRHVPEKECRTEILFTYKRKELRKGVTGAPIEVNDEKECTLSEAAPLEALLADAGFTVARTKHKITEGWFAPVKCGQAHIELCTVPPLGDFLEIEIISETEDKCRVDEARSEIEKLFVKCGIQLSAIEPKYYSELLAEAGADCP